MIGYKSNEQIEEFIKNKIGIEKYSYHQVQIFIKLFISQFNTFKCKLNFINEKKEDITDLYIQEFVEYTKYFISGGFAKLLTEKKKMKIKII